MKKFTYVLVLTFNVLVLTFICGCVSAALPQEHFSDSGYRLIDGANVQPYQVGQVVDLRGVIIHSHIPQEWTRSSQNVSRSFLVSKQQISGLNFLLSKLPLLGGKDVSALAKRFVESGVRITIEGALEESLVVEHLNKYPRGAFIRSSYGKETLEKVFHQRPTAFLIQSTLKAKKFSLKLDIDSKLQAEISKQFNIDLAELTRKGHEIVAHPEGKDAVIAILYTSPAFKLAAANWKRPELAAKNVDNNGFRVEQMDLSVLKFGGQFVPPMANILGKTPPPRVLERFAYLAGGKIYLREREDIAAANRWIELFHGIGFAEREFGLGISASPEQTLIGEKTPLHFVLAINPSTVRDEVFTIPGSTNPERLFSGSGGGSSLVNRWQLHFGDVFVELKPFSILVFTDKQANQQ